MAAVPDFPTKEEAEKSYQKSMDSYQDLLSMLKKTRNVPFTFSEYLDYWIKEIQALRRITIARSNEKNVKDRRNHFFLIIVLIVATLLIWFSQSRR